MIAATSQQIPHRHRNIVFALVVSCWITFSSVAASAAPSWKNLGTVTTLTNNQMCYTDGKNIVCDSSAPTLSGSNVGIGTTGPTTLLDVYGANGATAAVFGDTIPLYMIRNWPAVGFNASYFSGGWAFGRGSSSNYAGAIDFSPTSGQFTFLQSSVSGNAGAAATMNTNMVINQNGNVGIGTTSPLSLLTVNGNSNFGAGSTSGVITTTGGSGSNGGVNIYLNGRSADNSSAVYMRDNAGVTNYGWLVGQSTGIGLVATTGTLTFSNISSPSGGPIVFSVNYGEKMRVDTSGNVGIGTTSPATGMKVDINGPVKVAGTGSEACTASTAGAMRYNSTGQYMEICQ